MEYHVKELNTDVFFYLAHFNDSLKCSRPAGAVRMTALAAVSFHVWTTVTFSSRSVILSLHISYDWYYDSVWLYQVGKVRWQYGAGRSSPPLVKYVSYDYQVHNPYQLSLWRARIGWFVFILLIFCRESIIWLMKDCAIRPVLPAFYNGLLKLFRGCFARIYAHLPLAPRYFGMRTL